MVPGQLRRGFDTGKKHRRVRMQAPLRPVYLRFPYEKPTQSNGTALCAVSDQTTYQSRVLQASQAPITVEHGIGFHDLRCPSQP